MGFQKTIKMKSTEELKLEQALKDCQVENEILFAFAIIFIIIVLIGYLERRYKWE